MNLESIATLIFLDAFWSAIAATGFAIMFSTPRRLLVYCALGAAVGHSIRTGLMEGAGVSITFATLIGATVVGVMAYYMARRLRAPATIFSVVGVIPMVPGAIAFRAMIALVSIPETADAAIRAELAISALTNFIQTGLILGALAVGIAAPALLFDDRARPVV